MTCPKCHGTLITNHGETFCLNCAYRPAWGKPAPPEPPSLVGKHPRKGQKYTCKCGRPKVVWRSACITCANRQFLYQRKRAKAEKARRQRAAKQAFA